MSKSLKNQVYIQVYNNISNQVLDQVDREVRNKVYKQGAKLWTLQNQVYFKVFGDQIGKEDHE